jgi:hypothetical protein
MLQSGDGCDELTPMIGKGSRKKPAQMPFQPSLSPKSAQPISGSLLRLLEVNPASLDLSLQPAALALNHLPNQ